MKKLMDSEQMKRIDEYSINDVGIPSMVLMERAALNVTYAALKRLKVKDKVLCVCGGGNNGADGMAAARQLNEMGVSVKVYPVFEEGKGTTELKQQFAILKKSGILCINRPDYSEYNCIIDAVFGVGLSRNIEGKYAEVIKGINEAKENGSMIISVDVPSGINSSDGQVMGCAVKADLTVTFGFLKCGLCIYPGKAYAGEVLTVNAGFADVQKITEIWENAAFTYEDKDIRAFFKRPADSNKGSYGKLLIAAGSENMAGAALLAAEAAYRTGCGLVKVFTHENNKTVVLNHVPEAVMVTYADSREAKEKLQIELEWADCVIAGPGLSLSDTAKTIVRTITKYSPSKEKSQTVILDADALNIIAEDKEAFLDNMTSDKRYIYTPHMGEMSRITNESISVLKANALKSVKQTAQELRGICIMKDSATVVSDGEKVYINTSGNSGMAAAGSGDMLTGILAGTVLAKSWQKTLFEKACMGVYLHGRAGDYAKSTFGNAGMKAMDIANAAAQVLKDNLDIF